MFGFNESLDNYSPQAAFNDISNPATGGGDWLGTLGTGIGTLFGGPVGGAAGSVLGSLGGEMFGGGGESSSAAAESSGRFFSGNFQTGGNSIWPILIIGGAVVLGVLFLKRGK